MSEGQRLTSCRSRKESDFLEYLQSPIHAMVTLLYQTIQSMLRCNIVIRSTKVMAASRNFTFKIEAKPLRIETRLLLDIDSL